MVYAEYHSFSFTNSLVDYQWAKRLIHQFTHNKWKAINNVSIILQVWFWCINTNILYHDLGNDFTMGCTKSLNVFMGTKINERGRQRIKLHNYILHIKHSLQRVLNPQYFMTPFHILPTPFSQILSTPLPSTPTSTFTLSLAKWLITPHFMCCFT